MRAHYSRLCGGGRTQSGSSRRNIYGFGGLITADIAKKDEAGIEPVKMLSPLTSIKGSSIRVIAYGTDPATDSLVACRSAVGITTAQSIDEPGTQLTMGVFRISCLARDVLKAPEYIAKSDSTIRQERLHLDRTADGMSIFFNRMEHLIVNDINGREMDNYSFVRGISLLHADGAGLKKMNHSRRGIRTVRRSLPNFRGTSN
jgi:DNA-directed RNA polymerase subunit beta'